MHNQNYCSHKCIISDRYVPEIEISLAIDSLNLWVDKTASENSINIELLNAEEEKLK